MPTEMDTILKLAVPVIVQVGRRKMTLDAVLALGPGMIVELNKSADEELDLLVNNKRIGSGLAVKVCENFGVRVESIGSPKQRVEAMAS